MPSRIPEKLRATLQASVHTGLTLAFVTRGLEVPNEEISDEAQAVCAAVEPFLVRALLDAAALTPGSIPEDDLCPLSESDLEVLRMRAQSIPRAEQAEKLGITISGINSRMESIVKKLDARDQMHAYYIAIRNGWV